MIAKSLRRGFRQRKSESCDNIQHYRRLGPGAGRPRFCLIKSDCETGSGVFSKMMKVE